VLGGGGGWFGCFLGLRGCGCVFWGGGVGGVWGVGWRVWWGFMGAGGVGVGCGCVFGVSCGGGGGWVGRVVGWGVGVGCLGGCVFGGGAPPRLGTLGGSRLRDADSLFLGQGGECLGRERGVPLGGLVNTAIAQQGMKVLGNGALIGARVGGNCCQGGKRHKALEGKRLKLQLPEGQTLMKKEEGKRWWEGKWFEQFQKKKERCKKEGGAVGGVWTTGSG